MEAKETRKVFVTMWRGTAVAIPLLQFGHDFVPEGYLEKDVEVVRHWTDYQLATWLRSRGVPIVDPSLITSGTVISNRNALS